MRARTRLDLFRRRFFPPERAPRPRFAAHLRECADPYQRLGTDGPRQAIKSASALWASLGRQADAILPIKPNPRALASPTHRIDRLQAVRRAALKPPASRPRTGAKPTIRDRDETDQQGPRS